MANKKELDVWLCACVFFFFSFAEFSLATAFFT